MFSYASGRAALRESAAVNVVSIALEKEAALKIWREERLESITAIASLPSMIENTGALVAAFPDASVTHAAQDNLVQDLQSFGGHHFLDMFVIEPELGMVIASTDPGERAKFKENRPYFFNGKKGPYVQNPYYSYQFQGLAITFSAPILSRAGTLLGVLAGRGDLSEINDIVTRSSGMHQSEDVFIVDNASLLLTQPRFISDASALQRGIRTEVVNRCLSHSSGSLSTADYRGVATLAAYRWLTESQLCLVVKVDQAEAYGPVNAFRNKVAILGAIVLAAAALLGLGLASSINRPILAMQKGVRGFRSGEFGVRLSETSRDELGELARAFNEMARERERVEEVLRSHSDNLEEQVAARTQELEDRTHELTITNEELSRVTGAALEASRAKSEFLANMSHEIRTPMNAILGMADLLSETSLSSEQEEYVRVFQRAGENLLNVIDDILDLSKVEAGQLSMEEVDFDLGEVVEQTAGVLAPRAHEKGLDLNCRVAPDVPTALIGDPSRLRQVLVNLLGNAIKFTEHGEVTVNVETDPETDSSGFLRFQVTDTGIGIPEEKLEAIFDSFAQVDSSTTREYGGTGLGLAICRRLIGLMGGRIWVESTEGQGSTFYLTAKFGTRPDAARETKQPEKDLVGVKTLIVDDNSTNRLILTEMLVGWGASVEVAEDGQQALAELERSRNQGAPYELLLLDRRMPGMNGFQVVERIKQDLGITDITIMMLTSDDRSGDIARCRELGISQYLIKPVRRSGLYQAIIAAKAPKIDTPAVEPVDSPPAAGDQRALRILLVEDTEDNRMLIKAYLKNAPYQIDMAENGEIGVQKFTSSPYDIVLMDMQMPVMDGYAATQAIRRWEEEQGAAATPIIALTAYALKDEIQKSLEVGCTAHVTKPIKKSTLFQTIDEYAKAPVA